MDSAAGSISCTSWATIRRSIQPKRVCVLKGGSAFSYTMHLHSVGQEVRVRVDAAFKFHPKGWKPKYMQAGFVTMGLLRDELDIPGNTDDVRFESFYRVPRPGILTTFEPHMHASGKRMCVEAIYPDGRREMLNCAGYNHNWVKVYSYDDDVAPLLPAGTVLHVIGWYNNTTSNPQSRRPEKLEGMGQSLDRRHVPFHPEGDVAHRGAVQGKGRRTREEAGQHHDGAGQRLAGRLSVSVWRRPSAPPA